ncbi:hypothetical protein [Lysobacter gummosus]
MRRRRSSASFINMSSYSLASMGSPWSAEADASAARVRKKWCRESDMR